MTEPIALKVTRWKCPACSRSWSRKARAAEHAAKCWLNPANRSCKTCRHHVEADTEYGYSIDEDCDAGVALERKPDFPLLAILPLHCPKWQPDGPTEPAQEAS